MSIRTLIASLAVLSSTGSAIAQQQTYPYVDFTGFQSTKTRAEVMAELEDSKASGEYALSNREYAAPDMHFKSTKTRAEVMAELRQAQADGMYAQQDFDTQYPVLQNNGNISNLASGGN